MTLSASIMAHPVRTRYVEELRERLDRDTPVAWDNEGDPSRDRQRRWRTGRRAWEMHDPGADWHVVLQDDVTVCDDMLAGLENALTNGASRKPPHHLVQPYFGTRRPNKPLTESLVRRAQAERASWICMRALNWGVAIAAPVSTIPDMMKWCDGQTEMTYDMRVGKYYMRVLQVPTFYTHPSLVDHLELPSLVGHGGGRVAHRLHQGSALTIDWSGPVVCDPRYVLVQRDVERRRIMMERHGITEAQFVPGKTMKRRTGEPLLRRGRGHDPIPF